MDQVAAARRSAEIAARDSFGRLASWLAWQWRDIAAAEDALADALVKALELWPEQGIPDSPDAWLLQVAKRQLLQVARHERVCRDPTITILFDSEEAVVPPEIPDLRLRLMLVCAHPAIDEGIRTPLMLQTVLGLQAQEIAPAMLLAPATLAQRLVRAKDKIKRAGIRFEEPEASELGSRLQSVLEAIYGAFGLSVDADLGGDGRLRDLNQEALFLGQLVCRLLPESAEAAGLLALMMFRQSRQPAEFNIAGDFVPLSAQDCALWDRQTIIRADQLLWDAARLRQPGPFQLEAAIQSAHCHRLFFGHTPWRAIAALYGELNSHFGTIGSRVAAAVATKEAGDVGAALGMLDAMDASAVREFQPYWVARADLLRSAGRPVEARQALDQAIELTRRPLVRAYLRSLRESSGMELLALAEYPPEQR